MFGAPGNRKRRRSGTSLSGMRRDEEIPVALKTLRRSRFTSLSDEMMLRIFKLLPVKQLLRCQLVSRRFYHLASDNQLWKAAYHASFEYRMNVQRKPNSWQRMYKIKHNWSRGDCRVCKVTIARKPPNPRSLAQACGDLIVTADHTYGLRFWRIADDAVSLDASGKFIPDDSSTRYPSAIALSRLEASPWLLWTVVGFSDGLICAQVYDTRTRVICVHETNDDLASHAIVSLDFKYPYIAWLTLDQTFGVAHVNSCGMSSAGKASQKMRILSSLKANSAWSPLCLTMQTQKNQITVSVAYAMPVYTTGWSLGLQEILLDVNGILLQTKMAKKTDQTSAYQPIVCDKDLGNVSPLLQAQPNALSYAYPFLIAAQPDNTLVLFKMTSTKRNLLVEATASLSGHTSSIAGVFVGHSGKAVSVDARGSDVRIWDLEACIASQASGDRKPSSISLQPSPKASGKRCKTRDYFTSLSDFTIGKASLASWIGIEDEKLLLLQETDQGSESIMVYDFS